MEDAAVSTGLIPRIDLSVAGLEGARDRGAAGRLDRTMPRSVSPVAPSSPKPL